MHIPPKVLSTLRQLRFPAEFRIAPPAWPPQLRDQLARALEALAQAAPESVRLEAVAKSQDGSEKDQTALAPTLTSSPTMEGQLKFLADAGTGLWRMRRNMVQPGCPKLLDARPLEEMRKPFRWLVSTWDTLKESGLEIQDHTGDRYVSGQSLKAHFEAAPDLHEDTIIDTIKPSIYFGGRVIQMGEVVVGTPDLAASAQSQPSAAPAPSKPPSAGKSYFAT